MRSFLVHVQYPPPNRKNMDSIRGLSIGGLTLGLAGLVVFLHGIVRDRPTRKQQAVDASIILAGLILLTVASGMGARAASLRLGGVAAAAPIV